MSASKSKRPELIPLDSLDRTAEFLKILAHPVRIRMINILMQGRFSVGRIAELCDLPPHQASEHLRLMKGHGLLSSERSGRTVYYRTNDPRLPGLMNCIRKACATMNPSQE